MEMNVLTKRLIFFSVLVLSMCNGVAECWAQSRAKDKGKERKWLAGDHHIHSRFSARYDVSTDPPTASFDGEPYAIPVNAKKAKEHGLSWMVSTDHGGPNHSKINLEHAYPELQQSRKAVPELIQFHGMEFDAPAAGHTSLIIPHSKHEHRTLYEIESRFASREVFPRDKKREREELMLEALNYMKDIKRPPILIANHPSRGIKELRNYTDKHPAELRNWNDTAPDVAVGMEGAPGHQASTLNVDGSLDSTATRPYNNFTLGGFDQMTAILGGFWDSMLGEGRRWWITATSDSHVNWRDGGNDFWPGEYSKTYVYAEKNYDDILEGIRQGRVFVTTGDLISELYVTVASGKGDAPIGGTLSLADSADVEVTIRLRVPKEPNHRGESPQVARVDLIAGDITGPVSDRTQDFNLSTRVVKRFTAEDWTMEEDGYVTMTYTLENVYHSSYVRVRGTNTNELEPKLDYTGEDPWTDLWFYSNPVFMEIEN
jgi:hypothetical protein